MDTDSTVVFRGFMIQGRTLADNSPAGTWQALASTAQATCSGRVSYTNVFKHRKCYHKYHVMTDSCHSC